MRVNKLRVFLDANIFISYLLGSQMEGPIPRTVEAGFLGEYTLLITDSLLDEIAEVVTRKPFLAAHISPAQIRRFRSFVLIAAELVPEIEETVPALVRDPKDDYLLAHALVARADYLVTGDKDLLVLNPVGDLQILSPTQFTLILAEEP
jgi:putative PIN family toxin of toxin-antitoxin system